MRRNLMIEKLCASHTALQGSVPRSEETKQAFLISCNQEEAFRNKLAKYPHLLEEYNRINRIKETWCGLEANDSFLEGFRLGVLLGLDLADKDEEEEEMDE